MNQFKKKITAFTAMLAFLSLSQVPTLAVTTTDVLGHTTNTNITDTTDKRTDVTVNGGAGAVGQVDWKNFNVAGDEHVNFGFSNVSQTVINRVLGGRMSEIFGKMTNSCTLGDCQSVLGTSKVILINPAGVLFGQGSRVDLNSFTVSTFDFNGARNLEDFNGDAAGLQAYQNNTLNVISPDASVNQGAEGAGEMHFDSSYTQQFTKKGIEIKRGTDNQIKLDGATFAKFDDNTESLSNYNTNKSVALVADNVIYKDSIIRTGDNYNYNDSNTPTPNKSFGNVKIVTGDGVTFAYLANGTISDSSVKLDADKTNTERHVSIDNSQLSQRNNFAQDADSKGHIRSGNVRIYDNSKNANSDIHIKDTVIKGTKLVNGTNGNIWITGGQDVKIENSRLESANTSVQLGDTTTKNTRGNYEGKVTVQSGKDLTVKDSLILSAGSTNEHVDSGRVSLEASHDVKLQNSEVVAKGNANVYAGNGITATDTLIQAADDISKDNINNVTMKAGKGGITLQDTIVNATKDIDLRATDASGNLNGDITIKSNKKGGAAQNDNSSALLAKNGKVSVQGQNTRIEDSSLAYNELKFYNDGTQGLNNVTVAGDSTFSHTPDGASVDGNITIETNGNLTFDHANVQSAGYDLEFRKNDGTYNSSSQWKDNKLANAYHDYRFSINRSEAQNLTGKSTQGNVTVQNNSNLHAANNVDLTASKNLTANNSSITAGNTANLTAGQDASLNNAKVNATSGDVNVKGNKLFAKQDTQIKAGHDVNLNSATGIKFANDNTDGTNIGNTTKVYAGNDINVTADTGNIEYEATQSADMQYNNRLKFKATTGSNKFNSADSLKSVNVDYVAGVSNEFSTANDIQFVGSTLEAPKNKIETKNDGGDVILNNLEIKSATDDPKDTITEVTTKGNITTRKYGTNEEGSAGYTNKYPQSVNFDVQLSDDKGQHAQTTLDLNQTKFKAETKSPTSHPYDTKGSIDLQVRGADNKNAGIELKAENAAGWDEHSEENAGPEIHLNAEDDKLSVSKLVSDKLFLSEDDTLYAAPVDLTADELEGFPPQKVGSQPKGYIEVKDYEGFNFDNDLTKDDPANPNMDYTGHYVPGTRDPGDGTVQQTKEKHTFEDRQSGDQFLLDYTRPDFDCPPAPEVPVEPELEDANSLIDVQKLPREIRETSKTSKVSDNTVDQTSNIMSAAAKVDVSEETEATYADDDDDDSIE